MIVYLKQHSLKINGIEVDLTKRVLSHARGVSTRDIREDEEFNNSVETTQLKIQSQLILMEGSHTLKEVRTLY